MRASNHGVIIIPPDSDSALAKLVRGSRRNNSPAPHVFASVQKTGPSRNDTTKTNAASRGTLDKQDSHRIRCVTNNAGGFPERSTRPMVGSGRCGEYADTGWTGARASSSAKIPVRPGNAVHSHEQRDSLTSGRVNSASRRGPMSEPSLSQWQTSGNP
jgi:hypothetical protein